MEALQELLGGLNDYLKEITLCGTTSLNDKDIIRLTRYEEKGIGLGLSFGVNLIRSMKDNIYNTDVFILLLSELKEYIDILRFKIM